jgi:hypothetical protein
MGWPTARLGEVTQHQLLQLIERQKRKPQRNTQPVIIPT